MRQRAHIEISTLSHMGVSLQIDETVKWHIPQSSNWGHRFEGAWRSTYSLSHCGRVPDRVRGP